jgi:hypothetical protein
VRHFEEEAARGVAVSGFLEQIEPAIRFHHAASREHRQHVRRRRARERRQLFRETPRRLLGISSQPEDLHRHEAGELRVGREPHRPLRAAGDEEQRL